ncbi:MAG TPA: glycosyltransferase [Desulfobulbaceae bacterium]|nr:glycosyltransferase [Desulfobulbaceae bacterium]
MSVDFQRDIYCLFGLPIDNLTREQTIALLRSKAKKKQSIVWSTVNVNWVVQAFGDDEFRTAILNSDIVTLDGKPLLWLAKGLKYPMRETVPGSTLIQLLLEKDPNNPMTIFLFGGEEGAAELAMNKINQYPCGLEAVGALNPGFGSIEEMSTDAIINTINKTRPDILLVALGAKKGTQWIEYNRHRLKAGIISHLGATINFLAGTVQRAPRLFRSFGMEWIWRIFQEPKLFFRYARDGFFLTSYIIIRIPAWLNYRRYRPNDIENMDEIILKRKKAIIFGRYVNVPLNSTLRQQLFENLQKKQNLYIDCSRTLWIDGRFAALALLTHHQMKKTGQELTMDDNGKKLLRIYN